MLDAHDFISYLDYALIDTQETSHNRLSHSYSLESPLVLSRYKYPYDKFKSGKIIFKMFNASI